MRLRAPLLSLSIASSACLLLPCAAFAQEEQQKGMPQLDFGNPLTISQIVWLVIIFAVLYVALSGWALPKVGRVVNDRESRIANDLDTARAAKAEADAAAAEARQAARHSDAEAQAAIAQAVTDAKAQAQARAGLDGAALDARIATAEAAIAEARTRAMAGLHAIAADTASAIVARLIGRNAEPAAIEAAVGSAIARRG